jgi:DNA end-binding protein Ku
LAETRKVAIGQLIMHSQVRDDKELFKGIPKLRVKKDMVELAGELKDEYELALRKLVKRKAAGRTIERPAEEPPPTTR